jgi:hypothetical protein
MKVKWQKLLLRHEKPIIISNEKIKIECEILKGEWFKNECQILKRIIE